jgi:TolB-like protein
LGERLAAAAATVLETQSRHADAEGDGQGAIAAAERLAAIEATREDRQRIALRLIARHRGRDAALSRAKQLTDLLHDDLAVAPEPETGALIAAIERGDFEPARDAVPPVCAPVATPLSLPPAAVARVPLAAPAMPTPRVTASRLLSLWPRPSRAERRLAATLAVAAIVALGLIAGFKLWPSQPPQRGQVVAVLPFVVDSAATGDAAFAQALTHDVIGYLSRFGSLKVLSEQTSRPFGDHQSDVGGLNSGFGVRYAVVGHVRGNDDELKIDLQLVDTTTRTNVWSDHIQRERADPALVADEASRGIARMVAIAIRQLGVLHARASPSSRLTPAELVARGYATIQKGTGRDNLSDALALFKEALGRNPHYRPALVGIARVQITAAMNFVDVDVGADLRDAERILTETLEKSPDSISALYGLALLQKHRGQYEASMRLLQRCLEINPSFLPAQGQLGDVLIRMGQPQQGLQHILRTIRTATGNDPTSGYWYLFAAEAELELGHEQAALTWALRADAFMPGAPLVKAWLASIYATIGDQPNAAKSVALLTKLAPDRTYLFVQRLVKNGSVTGRRGQRIFDGLKLALSASLS